MNNARKIGFGFLFFGLLIIPLFYFIAVGVGFVLGVMIGLMAIVFGGFQLMLSKHSKARAATKAKRIKNRG